MKRRRLPPPAREPRQQQAPSVQSITAELLTPLRLLDELVLPLRVFLASRLSLRADAVRFARRERAAFVAEDEDVGGIQQWLLGCFAASHSVAAVLMLLGLLLSFLVSERSASAFFLFGAGDPSSASSAAGLIHEVIPAAMQIVVAAVAVAMRLCTPRVPTPFDSDSSDGEGSASDDDDDECAAEVGAGATEKSKPAPAASPKRQQPQQRSKPPQARTESRQDPHRHATVHVAVCVVLCALLAFACALGRSFRSPMLCLFDATVLIVLGCPGRSGAVALMLAAVVPAALLSFAVVPTFRFELRSSDSAPAVAAAVGAVTAAVFPPRALLDPVYGPDIVCAMLSNVAQLLAVAAMCAFSPPLTGSCVDPALVAGADSGAAAARGLSVGGRIASAVVPVFALTRMCALRSAHMRPSQSRHNPFLITADIVLQCQQDENAANSDGNNVLNALAGGAIAGSFPGGGMRHLTRQQQEQQPVLMQRHKPGFVESARIALDSAGAATAEPAERIRDLVATLTDIVGATAALSPPPALARLNERAHVLLDRVDAAASAAAAAAVPLAVPPPCPLQEEKRELLRQTQEAERALVAALLEDHDAARARGKYLDVQRPARTHSGERLPRRGSAVQQQVRSQHSSVGGVIDGSQPSDSGQAPQRRATPGSHTPSSVPSGTGNDSNSAESTNLGGGGGGGGLSSNIYGRSSDLSAAQTPQQAPALSLHVPELGPDGAAPVERPASAALSNSSGSQSGGSRGGSGQLNSSGSQTLAAQPPPVLLSASGGISAPVSPISAASEAQHLTLPGIRSPNSSSNSQPGGISPPQLSARHSNGSDSGSRPVSAQQQQQQQQSGVLAYIYAGTANRAVVEHQLKRELIASGARVHMLAVAKSSSYIVASWNVEAPCSDPELRAVRFATSEVEFDAAAAAAPAFAGGALAPPMRGGRGGGGGAQQQHLQKQRAEEMGIYGAAISAPVARLQAQIDSFEGAAAPLAETQKLKYMLIAAVEQQRWLFTDSVFFAAQGGVPLFKRFSIAPVDVVFARRGFMIDELLDPPREIPRWMVPRDDDNDDGGGAAARQDGGDGSVVLRVDGVEASGRGGADGSGVKMTHMQQTVLDAFAAAARNQLDAAGRLLDKVVAADATARRLSAVLRSM